MMIFMDNLEQTARNRSRLSEMTSWKTLLTLCVQRNTSDNGHSVLVKLYKSYIKTFWKNIQKHIREEEEKKKKYIAKLFVLHERKCYCQAIFVIRNGKRSFMENFIFCAVSVLSVLQAIKVNNTVKF